MAWSVARAGPELAGLAFALYGHGEHEGQGIFSCALRAGEDERVGETAGGDGGAESLDGVGVAEEVHERGREGGGDGWGGQGLRTMILGGRYREQTTA